MNRAVEFDYDCAAIFGVRRVSAAFKLSGALKESDSVANQSAVKPAHSKDALRQKKIIYAMNEVFGI